MSRYLVAVTTPGYVPRASAFLRSVQLMRTFHPVLVQLDFTPETDPEGNQEKLLAEGLPWLDRRKMDLPKDHSNFMVQHLSHTVVTEAKETDLICLCDADVVIQRDFTEKELSSLEGFWDLHTIGVWWNGGPQDLMAHEAERIGLNQEWRSKYLSAELAASPVMNCGVMMGHRDMFDQVQKCYQDHCEEFYAASAHRSRCQFLLNWCWWKLGVRVVILPPQIHQHGHCGIDGRITLPVAAEFRGPTLCLSDGTPVVFKHNFPE